MNLDLGPEVSTDHKNLWIPDSYYGGNSKIKQLACEKGFPRALEVKKSLSQAGCPILGSTLWLFRQSGQRIPGGYY